MSNVNGCYITCRKATRSELSNLDTVVVRADPLLSTLAWQQNEQYCPSQKGNQYSDSGFLLNHQSCPFDRFPPDTSPGLQKTNRHFFPL